MHRKRVLLSWHPIWSPQIEAWTAYQIKTNLWRFDSIDCFEDVMQDAKILWWSLEKKYPVVNQMAHFVALYKTSLKNVFANKACYKRDLVVDKYEELTDALQVEGNLPNCGYLNLLVDELPDELKLVLHALTTGRKRLKLDKPSIKRRYRENHNMRLKRRFSLTTADPVGDLRNHFSKT